MSHPRVVIVGGGFGGLNAALALRRVPVEVTLVDRRNFHLFQPLLYQVATGGLSPANIASPLRAVLRRQKNARVLLGEVTDFDIANREVVLGDERLPYDTLIVAAGMTNFYFGHPEWESLAPGLKSVEDATTIRARVLRAFENAERSDDPAEISAQLTFAVIGGGPTGVELAGAICELARQTLKRNFRRIDPAKSRVILIEGADRLLPTFRPQISARATSALARLGAEVWVGARVTAIRADSVTIHREGKVRVLAARTTLWAAGVQASPLGRKLAAAANAQTDRADRVIVEPDLTIAGHPEVFVIGDLAAARQHGSETILPGVAQVAIQEGRYVGETIRRRIRGSSVNPFRYADKGSMATIGRSAAVVDLGWTWFSGHFAWLTWLFIHILFLIQFENRMLVMLQWAWNYVTRNRSARLITGEPKAYT